MTAKSVGDIMIRIFSGRLTPSPTTAQIRSPAGLIGAIGTTGTDIIACRSATGFREQTGFTVCIGGPGGRSYAYRQGLTEWVDPTLEI